MAKATPPAALDAGPAPVRPRAPGSEVSVRIVRAVLEVSERRGLDGESLLHGLFGREQLRRSKERVGWDAFAEFLDRVQAAWGGPEGMAQAGYQVIAGHRAMALLAGLLVSPRRLYLSAAEQMARRMYSNVGVRGSELADGRIATEYRILSERGSLPYAYASLGAFRAYPRLLGYPDARVSAQISSHHSRFVITLPRAARLSERAGAIGGLVTGTLSLGTESLDDIELAFDDSGVLRDASELGQSLVSQQSLEALAAAMFELLERYFLCQSASLWAQRPGAGEVRVAARGRASGHDCERELCAAGRRIGRLTMDLPHYASHSPSPLLDALLPWLAIGLDRCLKPEPGADSGPKGDRAARAWALSRRQAQVLELLLRGCQNKEIATALGCSPRTVETHVSEILRRAGATNRSELIVAAMS